MMSPPDRIGIDPTLMTQLIGEIKRLQPAWSEVDAQINNALRTIGASMSGPGLLRDIGYQIAGRAPDLQRRLDLIIATQKIGLDKGLVWADESLWVSNSPAGGATVATSIADQLRQAWRQRDFSDRAVTEKVLDLLEKHQHDPYFAVAFAKEMRPKELIALVADLYRTLPGNPRDSHRWKDPATTEVDRLVQALSVTLGTASRGVGDMRLPKGYTDELISVQGEALTGFVINRLLRHGAFDDAFLRDLVNKVYDNAQRPPGESQQLGGLGPGFAAALANNPRVAQDFFTDPARKPLDFLMHKTQWSGGNHELGRAIEAATTTYRDNAQPPGSSRGYKSALIASWAIHFWADPRVQRAIPDTGQSAARILATYMGDVHRIAGTGTSEGMGVNPLPDNDSNLPGAQPYGALFDHDSVKSTMTWAFKDPQALKTVVEGHGEYSVKVFDAQGMQIDNKLDTKFAEWNSDHPNATKAEQAAQRQKILEDGMAGNVGELFNARVYDLSKSLHFIVDAGNLADINEADRKDEVNKAFKDALTRTLKLSLAGSGDWVVGGYEFIESNVSDQVKFNEGQTARSEAEATLHESQSLFKDLTANAMMRHGLLGDGSPASTHPHAFENYAKGSQGDFIADGRIIPRSAMSATQQLAYNEWLKNSPASAIFRAADRSVWEGFQRPVPTYPEADE
ncbi:hypothetical protein ACTMTF_36160 [Nonomuraea sp. ZG12]|uniref:hypothetical protein n=1 Tax=Nonomuraea sp. ZG12 TaxID=3452207 RepID=UPI003F88AB8A